MDRQSWRKRSLRRIVTVVMAVVILTSAFAGTAMANTGVDEADPADEVFIDEDGNAVLLYEDDPDEASGEVGIDVAESIAYALVTDDVEDDISAVFSMALSDEGVTSSGSFSADRPGELANFAMDVTGEQSQEKSEFDADLELVLDTDEAPEAAFIQSASGSGETVSGGDEFSTDGEISVTHILGHGVSDNGLDLTISESDGDYTVDVGQQSQLDQWEADDWRTADVAKETLEAKSEDVAQQLGGDATVTIHSHEFDEDDFGGGHLDVEYTIELENVEDGLETMIATGLAEDPELDLDQDETEQLAADILAVEIDALEVSYLMSGNTVEADWNVAFSDFDSAAFAAFELFDSVDEMDEEFEEAFEEYAETYEAQMESDLTTTSGWELSFTHGDGEATLAMELSSDTENWAAYTAALDDRDVDTPEFTMSATGETVDDEIDVEMNFEMSQEDFLDEAISAMVADLENDPTADDDAIEFMSAFEQADLELAKLDVDLDDGTVEIEMGAKFDDFAAFEDHLEDAFDGLSIAHIYGDLDDGDAYVYATEMVDADATEEDVRSHGIVDDDDTVVHMPDEWDEDHPRLDMQQVSEYLSLDTNEQEGDDDDIPGFGVAVALVAVLSTVLLLRRH